MRARRMVAGVLVAVALGVGAVGCGGDAAAGKVVFTANCAGCHTLADAGASGAVGPNLDASKPAEDAVAAQVANGGASMPAFADRLSEQEIADVAAYVAGAAGG